METPALQDTGPLSKGSAHVFFHTDKTTPIVAAGAPSDGRWVVVERRKEGKETQIPSPKPPCNATQGDTLPLLSCWGHSYSPALLGPPVTSQTSATSTGRMEPSSPRSPTAAPRPCCHSSPASSQLTCTTLRPPHSSLQARSHCPRGQSLSHTGSLKGVRGGY